MSRNYWWNALNSEIGKGLFQVLIGEDTLVPPPPVGFENRVLPDGTFRDLPSGTLRVVDTTP